MHRRHLMLGTVALLLAPGASAKAGEIKNYDAKAFAAAQEAGQSVVVAINAPW